MSKREKSKDEKLGARLCGIGLLGWLLGAASFGVTGGNMVTVIIANLGFLFGPIMFLFGGYLVAKEEVLRWFKKR